MSDRVLQGGFRKSGPTVYQKDFRPGRDCFWCKQLVQHHDDLCCAKCQQLVDEAYGEIRMSRQPERSDAETVAYVRDYLAARGRI